MPQLFDQADDDSMELLCLRCAHIPCSGWKSPQLNSNWNVKQISFWLFRIRIEIDGNSQIKSCKIIMALTWKSLRMKIMFLFVVFRNLWFLLFWPPLKINRFDVECVFNSNFKIRHDNPIYVANDISIFSPFYWHFRMHIDWPLPFEYVTLALTYKCLQIYRDFMHDFNCKN